MDLRQIQYFVCLYEESNVTRAARRLNIVQPALSMQILKIESEIKQKLFERTSHGMQPTAAARKMYQLFLPILRDLGNAQRELTNLSGQITGHISVGLVTSVSQSVLVQTMAEFAEKYPGVEVTVNEGYSSDLIDWVNAGTLDLAVINRPQKTAGLLVEHIFEEEFVVVSGRKQGMKLPRNLSLEQLARCKLVLVSKRNGLRQIIDRQVEHLSGQLRPKIEIDALPSQCQLIVGSDWVGLLPRILVHRELQRGLLRAHRLRSPRVVRNLVWIQHARKPLIPAARKFVEILIRNLMGVFDTPLAEYESPRSRGKRHVSRPAPSLAGING
jgi:DNA-binding transcriptional LysR family regulator